MSERVRVEYQVRGASGTTWVRWMNDDSKERIALEMAECADNYNDLPLRVLRVTTTITEEAVDV